MSTSIEQARCDVHETFAKAMACADRGEQRSLWIFEQELWTRMLALGRALVVLFLARQVARPRAAKYKHGGVTYVLRDWRTTKLGTRFGKIEFSRPVGRRPNARKVKADLPIDRELGLGSGFSLGVLLGVTRLCAQMAFANARSTYRDIYEWSPSPRAVMRMVDGVGGRARAFLEEAPAPEDDGEILVLQVDAGGAPMISHAEYVRRRKPKRKRGSGGTHRGRRKQRRRDNPRPRRTTGKKSKNAKMAVVAAVYTLRQTPEGIEGPINKRIIATFESHRALFDWLAIEAKKRGYGKKRTLFIADGAKHIWDLQEEYFPEAEACLDWFHLAEYLWTAGRSFAKGSKLTEWVTEQKRHLRSGDIAEVIAEMSKRLSAIPKTGPGNKGKRERLSTALGYLEKHQKRMPYQKLIAEDLDIGSGAIEGAVRNLVRMRLDGPGMRWGRKRAELVLHLRCILLNSQWGDFTDHLALSETVPLSAQPEPTQPHTAKAKAA